MTAEAQEYKYLIKYMRPNFTNKSFRNITFNKIVIIFNCIDNTWGFLIILCFSSRNILQTFLLSSLNNMKFFPVYWSTCNSLFLMTEYHFTVELYHNLYSYPSNNSHLLYFCFFLPLKTILTIIFVIHKSLYNVIFFYRVDILV